MLVDISFLLDNWLPVTALVLLAFFTNTLINASTMKALGRSWRTSIYIGALLSQVGEFSFVLAAVGKELGIMTEFGYQMVLGVIVGTLVLGPAWIGVLRPLRGPSARVAVES